MVGTVLGRGDILVNKIDLISALMGLIKGRQMLNNYSKLTFNYK